VFHLISILVDFILLMILDYSIYDFAGSLVSIFRFSVLIFYDSILV